MKRYQQAPNVHKQETSGQVIVSVEEDRWCVLEGTSVMLWRLLQNAVEIHALVDECCRTHAGDPERIRHDVETTVEDWLSRGLVVDVE